MNRVCNEDCLHCPYEDCILDDVSASSEAELKEIDVAFARPEVKKTADLKEYFHNYYQTNKEWIEKRSRAYYEANREEILAKQRKHLEMNKEEINARRRARRKANPEEARAKANAYIHTHKEEVYAQRKRWREANIEKMRAYERAYARAYRAKNRDKLNAQAREWWRKKKEEAQAAKANAELQTNPTCAKVT